MRTLVLATSIAALFGMGSVTASFANPQSSGAVESSLSLEAPVDAAIGAGMTEDTTWASNRVYVLPPEVDVEVTGSVTPRHCVGDTIGTPLCPDTIEGEAR